MNDARPIKVLIVEDDLDLQSAYEMILESQGFDVETASDGMYAMNKLRNFTPDVILLDYFMPRMDGKNFLENFDKDNYPGTKIVLCSNIADKNTIDQTLALGADMHVTKSDISPLDLVNLVKDITPVS